MERKAVYRRSLGEAIAKRSNPALNKAYHVVRLNPEKWVVQSSGALKPLRVFPNKRMAVAFATRYAGQRAGMQVFVHGIDGRVQQRISLADTSS